MDLDELVRATAARASRTARARGRAIRVASETLIAEADPLRIDQALTNPIDNALLHGKGVVTVRLREGPDRIALAVYDQGEGFPAEFRTVAFERFTRAADRPRHGAGLGLAIVSAIAEAHGGTAAITTEHPSSVVVSLPTRSPTPPSPRQS